MSKPEVILYTSTGCPYCEKVKLYFKEHGVEYEERNTSQSKEYLDQLRERKIFGLPATVIDGKVVLGFQEKRFKKLLNIGEKTADGENSTAVENEEQTPDSPVTKQEETIDTIFQAVDQRHFDKVYDFVTIGGGPAGASAAVYAARAKLDTLVIDKAPKAGTLAITHKIANYPGVQEALTGLELLTRMLAQAKSFGAEMVRSTVLSVDFSGDIKKIEIAEGTIRAKSVFIAVGAKAPNSKVKGEEEFTGRGVSYCSTCDAAFYEGRSVVVVGDNEEAIHEATMLAKFCSSVKLLLPSGQIKGEADLSQLENDPKVEIYRRYRVKEIEGGDSVERVVVLNDQREEEKWEVDGVFLYLGGMKPGTDFLEEAVQRDEEGYVVVDEYLRTNVPGVFAGGDARRTPIKQAVISAADGAIAALAAEQHINNKAKLTPQYN